MESLNQKRSGENFAEKKEIAREIAQILAKNTELKNGFYSLDKDDLLWRGGMGIILTFTVLNMLAKEDLISRILNDENPLKLVSVIIMLGELLGITVSKVSILNNIIGNKIKIALLKNKFSRIN